MEDVLPPQAGLTVGGLVYRYTVNKELQDEFEVTVQNENAIDGGFIFQETDNWDGRPGNTILKSFQLNDIPKEYFGDGSIVTQGTGEVIDPSVRYAYTYDVCYDPLSSPECPGWQEAFYKWLLDNGLFNENTEFEDPYLNEYLQSLLYAEKKAEEDEAENDDKETDEKSEEELEKEKFQKMLALEEGANALVAAIEQEAIMNALTRPSVYDLYRKRELEGGEYLDTVELRDKKINDNRGAAVRMGLAQDKVHNEMVSSQYNK